VHTKKTHTGSGNSIGRDDVIGARVGKGILLPYGCLIVATLDRCCGQGLVGGSCLGMGQGRRPWGNAWMADAM